MGLRILFLFTAGRKRRLAAHERGEAAPLDFLFGLPYLRRCGYEVDLLEFDDFHPDWNSPEWKSMSEANRVMNARTRLTSSSHLFSGAVDRLNAWDLIIAANEYVAFGLSDFRRRGELKSPFLFFVMGMISQLSAGDKTLPAWRIITNRNSRLAVRCYRQLIESSHGVLFMGKGEQEFATQVFPQYRDRYDFLPFCVDTDFWTPGAAMEGEARYVLFMGNDARRDYALAVKIAKAMNQTRFTFVTKMLTRESVPPNVKLMVGDWKKELLSDAQIREILRGCDLVVLPLRDTTQPSGQSVALQAMACGKTIVISKTRGFWDSENCRDGQHLVFVGSHSAADWCRTIEELLCNDERRSQFGRTARLLVEEKYNLAVFGRQLLEIIRKLETNRRDRVQGSPAQA